MCPSIVAIEAAGVPPVAGQPTWKEMVIAREVQASLLGGKMPKSETLEYSVSYVPAGCVGGDFYDFLDLGLGRLALILGDVAGKGIPGALMMAALQASLRSHYSAGIADMPRLLQSVNHLFFEWTAAHHFATLFAGEYSAPIRLLRYVNCGHNPPLLVRKEGTVERLQPTATVLGLFADWECTVEEATLRPGDTLLLFSDGIIEAPGNDGEEFGEQRLIGMVQAGRHLPAADLARSITARINVFAGGARYDDVTLIVARAN